MASLQKEFEREAPFVKTSLVIFTAGMLGISQIFKPDLILYAKATIAGCAAIFCIHLRRIYKERR